MKLKVFDVDMGEISKNKASCIIDPVEQASDLLSFTIEEIEEIYISKDEITVGFKGHEWSPIGSGKSEDMAFWFALKYKEFDNGGGVWVDADEEPEIDWDCINEFYETHAGPQGRFVTAIDKGDFKTIKELNKEYPDICIPSINDSFYARWLVKIGSIDVMEWAKSVDDNIDFGPGRNENPLKIAIGYNYEELAIWLLDNYSEISVIDKYEPLALLKKAREYGMEKLIIKMLENQELLDMVIDAGAYTYLPEEIKELFVF